MSYVSNVSRVPGKQGEGGDKELKVWTPASVQETPLEEGHPHGNLCQKGPGGEEGHPHGNLPKRAKRKPNGRKATPWELAKKDKEETPWEEGHPMEIFERGPKTGTQFCLWWPKTFMNIDESKVVCYVDGEELDVDWHTGKD